MLGNNSTFAYVLKNVLNNTFRRKETVCRTAFERYPFGVIFSKTAPPSRAAIEINYDEDFCYYYFSPVLERWSRLRRSEMCTGNVNAKRDFKDYVQYFQDDINVMQTCTNNHGVVAFCEPWSPPGISSFVYTRKTALQTQGSSFMLGCFDLVDDVSLGVAKFKRLTYDANSRLSPTGAVDISDKWFCDAFEALPNGAVIIPMTPSNEASPEERTFYSNWHFNNSALVADDCKGSTEKAVSRLNEEFRSFGQKNDADDLLSNAAWITNFSTESGKLYDIGTYAIQNNDIPYQVIILRPTMISSADPFYCDGRLIQRGS